MSHGSTMKRCPDCDAPNPESQTTCFACGQSLDKPRPAVPPAASGEHTYPCLSCHTAVPYSATVCPGCGRILRPPIEAIPPALESGLSTQQAEAMNLVTLAVPPDGWTVLPLPDGTVRLTRNGWQRLWRDASPVFVAAGLILWLVVSSSGRIFGSSAAIERRSYGAEEPADYLLFCVLTVAAIGAVLWSAWRLFGREELRAGRSLLEVRKELGPFKWVRQMTIGTFRLATYETYTRNGTEIRRRLHAENAKDNIVLDGRDRSAFWGGTMPDEELIGLGRYLAFLTGWPFFDFEGSRWH